MTQSRETKLMLAVQSGDLSAFEQLVERYQDMVYGLALSMLRSPEDAEEAAQDAFVKLFRARDQFDVTKEVEPWLLRIAGNACRDRLRRRKTLGNLPVLRDESAQELANQIADPSVVGESVAAMRQLIRSELDRLSEGARLPLELKYHRGLTNAQIAEALGMSLSNVKVQLARAKDILASRLGKVLEA
jgi:RNA polymerase sigma-70 factor (ECF subfamily)